MAIKVGDNQDVAVVEITTAPIIKSINSEDPYDSPGERAEGMFIGKLISRVTGESDGFCSTYREWHIFCRGLFSGFKTVLTGKFDICPDMWKDEVQYYEGGQELGYVARNAFIFLFTGSVGTEVVLNSSSIVMFIGKFFGV
jgi:hypothetical protein